MNLINFYYQTWLSLKQGQIQGRGGGTLGAEAIPALPPPSSYFDPALGHHEPRPSLFQKQTNFS